MIMKDLLVFMGGPGCGKGTVAREVCDIHPMDDCIEMGALFRALPDDSEIVRNISAGNLASDRAVYKLIRENLVPNKNILLDGFPRTINQAKWFVKNYADKFNIKIIYLNTPEQLLKQRIKKRHTEGSGRADDADDHVINTRIKNFNTQTMPAVEWLRGARGIQFFDIDGAPAPDVITNNIMNHIK